MNCSVVPFAIERFEAVTAMETRVGAEECTACEQLDIRTRAQTEAKTALHPWYTGRELAILKSSNQVDYLAL